MTISQELPDKATSKTLIVLAFAEFCERFNFFGVLAILVLYLTKIFLLSDRQSYSLYGAYLAFSFALPFIGGLITDKLLGNLNAIIAGALLLFFGNVLLLYTNLHLLYVGIAAIICGSAAYKTTCTGLVGKLYKRSESEKSAAYTSFYAAMNAGAILGPLTYGIVARIIGWRYCFLLGASLILISLVAVIVIKIELKGQLKQTFIGAQNNIVKNMFGYGLIIAVFFLTSVLLSRPIDTGPFLLLFSISVLVCLFFMVFNRGKQVRWKIYGLLLLSFFSIFFFAATLQVGSSITLFISRHINKGVLGWDIPTTFFTALDPFFVVLMAPVFAVTWKYLRRKNREPVSFTKLGLGLIIAGIGFLFFVAASVYSSSTHNFMVLALLIFGYLLLGGGEICIAPAIFASISKYSPEDMQNTMIGMWYLGVAISGYLGGALAKLSLSKSANITTLSNTGGFTHVFIITASMVFIIGIIVFLSTPLAKKLLGYQNY